MRGGDADYGVTLLVEDDGGAERVRPAGEMALPETVAQDHNWGSAAAVFVGGEGAALREAYAQNGEKVGRNFAKVDVFGFSRLADGAAIEEGGSHIERADVALAIEK